MHWNITKILIFLLQETTTQIPAIINQIDAEQRNPLLQYTNQGGHATWYPRYLCLTVHHPPMSNMVQVSKATEFIS